MRLRPNFVIALAIKAIYGSIRIGQLRGKAKVLPKTVTPLACVLIRSYSEAESLFNIAMASCTVVINCAGKMMVEFFSVAISAIVCSVRS